ncbi:unnamed protein product, partial [marine sediment metagenome]
LCLVLEIKILEIFSLKPEMTPLMTFDPDKKKTSCTPGQCIVPMQIKKFYYA